MYVVYRKKEISGDVNLYGNQYTCVRACWRARARVVVGAVALAHRVAPRCSPIVRPNKHTHSNYDNLNYIHIIT